MLYIAICEDEASQLAAIRDKVQIYLKENNILAELEAYGRSDLLKYDLQEGKYFDIILSDIEMPDTDGMKLAKEIRGCLPDAILIFVTAYLKYAIDAYELEVFRYIPKSCLDEKLPGALEIAIKRVQSQADKSYLIQTAARIEKILLKQIVYIQKDGKNAMIICTDSSVKSVRKSLSDVHKELNSKDFVFVERGSIVNIAQIKSIQKEEVLLSNGVRIHASRPRLEELKVRMAIYWSEHI
ncbi:LytR/AlgR family response regulator transcription factor [Acetatifactor aquisgranensis]|uniref:LytR/AlgR family response regulator transcription factor n=1 Tax=Acetatifactor aquisgranensis TaxID=2941233 RepID=UPI00203C69C4|nr:LytTR family DNA-binding domain-containing protein [Acetatifactor aquisgranensis]